MDCPTTIGLRNLRIFFKVAELRGVRKAADAISLSQPTISQAVARLEAQVGVSLFERCTDGIHLTRAGAILAHRTELMFGEIEEALLAFGLSAGKGQSVDTVIQRMNRSQIRVLQAINEGPPFTDAAGKFGISPVSMHRAARDLAYNLGKPLFDNSPTGPTANALAVNLASSMTLALREIEWALDEIRSLGGSLRGELRIGVMPFGGGFLLGSVLGDIATHMSSAHARITTGDGNTLANALRTGEIDFIVGMVPTALGPGEFHGETLISSPLVLVGRKDHPLSGKKRIAMSDLEACDWIVPTRGATRRAVFDRLLGAMQQVPPHSIEAYSPATFRYLIGESDWITMMTRFEFEHEAQHAGLAILPYVPGAPEQSFGVAWRAEWHPSALHLKFMELMRSRAVEVADVRARSADKAAPGSLGHVERREAVLL